MSDTPPIVSIPSTSQPPTSARPTTTPASSSSSATPASVTPTTSATTQSSATTNSGSSSTPSTSATPLTTPLLTTSSNGGVATIYSTVVTTQTATSQNNPSTPNSFFSNKGAVAGVFSVVGLIALALVIALIVNAVRRRRAQKFDRDVAEAAAEAAASSRSPFDDYGYANTGGNGGPGGSSGYGYSDNSHGTYQLPPMSAQNAPYGTTEMAQYDPYAPGAAPLVAAAMGRARSRKDSDPRAPGIAGVGAGTLAREPSKRAPYNAFAGPAPQSYDTQGDLGRYGSRRSNHDILEAAGLGGAGVAAAAFANNTTTNANNNGAGSAYVTRKPSDTQFGDGRSNFGSMSSGGHHPTPLQPGYPVESYYPQRNDSLSPDPFAGYPVTTVPASQGFPNPHDATTPGPLPSIAGHQSDHVENVDTGSPTALRADEQRMSYQDDTDYSQGHRVLRVANE